MSAPYIQTRCINLVKRGMIALAPDWLGTGQLHSEGFHHYRVNQLDLCGTSGVSPFFLSLQRGIDLLLSLEHADPERVAVSGCSGGGWQSIFLGALDTRISLCNPVAGYADLKTRIRSFSDVGDSEQVPCDLAIVADYTHLTALRAPQATLLTFNVRDQCCFMAGRALPPLLATARPVFALYGKTNRLQSHINFDPGDHNFAQDNREAFYRMFGAHFYDNDPAFDSREIACDAEMKTAEELFVSLPPDNLDFHKLALSLNEKLSVRRTKANAVKERARLHKIVRAHELKFTAEKIAAEESDGVHVNFWKLKMGEWTVPAVEFVPHQFTKSAVVMADAGRVALSAEINRLLESGHRVQVLDVFNFGEAQPSGQNLVCALLIDTVGERSLGVAVSQMLAAARWFRLESGMTPTLISIGPRTGLIASVAGALQPDTFSAVEPREALLNLSEVITRNWTMETHPEMFCFGLLEAFEMMDLKRLASDPG